MTRVTTGSPISIEGPTIPSTVLDLEHARHGQRIGVSTFDNDRQSFLFQGTHFALRLQHTNP
jgi:hypothetical protein